MTTRREMHRQHIVEYLSDPDNEWLSRTDIALNVCNYKQAHAIYRIFTPTELDELEREALEIRKKRSAGRRAKVYDAMYNSALGGDVQAQKAYLDRMEGPITNKTEVSGPDGGPIEMTDTERAARLAAILEAARRRAGESAGD